MSYLCPIIRQQHDAWNYAELHVKNFRDKVHIKHQNKEIIYFVHDVHLKCFSVQRDWKSDYLKYCRFFLYQFR